MGCFLYKMCFFKDCFEESTLAILSARYDVPEKHNYSEGLIALLGDDPLSLEQVLISCMQANYWSLTLAFGLILMM